MDRDAADRFICRTKQSGARGNLKALYVAAQSAQAMQADVLVDTQKAPLRLESADAQPLYEYVLHRPTGNAFRFDARGLGPMSGDLWHIDETGRVWNETSACGPLDDQQAGR